MQPLVSVLMTSYNREKFIAAAIESVLASTYTNFELIVVDDCSSDRTVEIARQYAAKDERIKVYLNEKNLGDYFNRNRAASYAAGKYIKYLDSDDMIYPHGLYVFVNSMEQFPEAAIGITSSTNQDDKPYPYQMSPLESYTMNFYRRSIFATGPTGLIYRTEAFRALGGYSGKRYIGDSEFNMKLAARYPVIEICASLVFWRRHEGQEFMAGIQTTGYISLELPMYEEALLDPACPLSKEQVNKLLAHYRKHAARGLLVLAVKRRQPAEALQLFKKLKLSSRDIINAVFFLNKKNI